MLAAMIHISRILRMIFALTAMLGLAHGPAAMAQGNNVVIIRDVEIEESLKEWANPLLKAAGLNPASVDIIIVQSPQINAFVAGGQNIFLYTGLLMKTENPEEILGVMAHEMGHIAGGHLVATRAAMERASYESILGGIIGLGAAIASGKGGAAVAIISGSGDIAKRRFLSHSRVQESSADQAGLKFLETAQISPRGLVSFFEKLRSEELLPETQQSEYMRTHPLTSNRIDAVMNKAQQSPYYNTAAPAAWGDQYARMKAKLVGFVTPEQVPWTYSDQDPSIPARYARAIAAYRTNSIDKALTEIDALIAQEPDNPYFHELKGQMLVDFGRVKDGIAPYRKAIALKPDAGLIRISLANAIMEADSSPAAQREAIEELKRSLKQEPRAPRTYRLLATAYGRLGEEIPARLNLAEEAALQARFPDARAHAEFVVNKAKPGSASYLQAKDILAFIDSVRPPDQ